MNSNSGRQCKITVQMKQPERKKTIKRKFENLDSRLPQKCTGDKARNHGDILDEAASYITRLEKANRELVDPNSNLVKFLKKPPEIDCVVNDWLFNRRYSGHPLAEVVLKFKGMCKRIKGMQDVKLDASREFNKLMAQGEKLVYKAIQQDAQLEKFRRKEVKYRKLTNILLGKYYASMAVRQNEYLDEDLIEVVEVDKDGNEVFSGQEQSQPCKYYLVGQQQQHVDSGMEYGEYIECDGIFAHVKMHCGESDGRQEEHEEEIDSDIEIIYEQNDFGQHNNENRNGGEEERESYPEKIDNDSDIEIIEVVASDKVPQIPTNSTSTFPVSTGPKQPINKLPNSYQCQYSDISSSDDDDGPSPKKPKIKPQKLYARIS